MKIVDQHVGYKAARFAIVRLLIVCHDTAIRDFNKTMPRPLNKFYQSYNINHQILNYYEYKPICYTDGIYCVDN